jgi:acetolactate synthase-1/2/3 large subunit
MTTIADSVAAALADAGVRRCFTVPGESFLGLLDAVDREPRLTLVSCRHESAAAFMADAEAKLTGTPAVALASRAPGACNLAIGVQTAHEDGTPLVAILGQVESSSLGTGALQEIDLAALYRPLTKATLTARAAAEVLALTKEALRLATGGRPGPVAVIVPADYWQASAPSPADRLAQAERPVAIVGGEAVRHRAALLSAAERLGLGVYTAFRRQHAFPNDHPNYLGHLPLGAPGEVVAAAHDADVVLLVGARLDEVTAQRGTIPAPGAAVLAIGPPDDLAAQLEALAAGPARTRDWSQAHAAAVAAADIPDEPADGVHPARAIAALRRAIGEEAIVTTDAGNFSAFLHRHWWFGNRGTLLGPCNGAMGYAVPAAVAARLVDPGVPVVAVVGDGGVLMTGEEIETAVRLGAPILVFVLQNGLYGTIAMHQARAIGRTAATEMSLPDLGAWARALGAGGCTVSDEAELDAALAAALEHDGPFLVAVRTDPDIIAPGTRLSELIGTPA